MKNTFGQSVCVTLFGESHGEMIGAVLDGLAPGIKIDEGRIAKELSLRRPFGAISTPRQEPDPFSIVSGVKNGVTTGTPIAILIPNTQTKSSDYDALSGKARPGHADYAAECKYHGYQDERGGGHFSGRITAALCAAGSICRQALEKKDIVIGTHIARCAGIADRSFDDLAKDIASLSDKPFAVLDDAAGERMQAAILDALQARDSVGGELETVILGMPAGVGEPWFDSVESRLSHAMFGIGGVKGISFGDGFALCDKKGSQANDSFRIDENGKITTVTNRNGGINGGITNGMPITFRLAIKPTPTISLPQETVDFRKGENIVMEAKGRHDPAIVHRVRAVVDAMTSIVLCDLLSMRYGTDYLMP